MRIILTWRYLLAFAALTMLCGTSHEFVHHFTGAILCHGFGTKTFNSFTLAPGCEAHLMKVYWAALAGPIFTFALMWTGYALMRSPKESTRRKGFALVFANFPINRMLFVLLGGNDEQYANKLLFGHSHLVFLLTILAVWAVCLPPLARAFLQLPKPHRVAWFSGFFLLPFVFVLIVGGSLEQLLLMNNPIFSARIIGVPCLIIAVELICLVLYKIFKAALSFPVLAEQAGNPRTHPHNFLQQ